MPNIFTIQGDDVYWNGQLVAKLVVSAPELRDSVEDYLLEHSFDGNLEEFRDSCEEAFTEGYFEGYDAGYAAGREERD